MITTRKKLIEVALPLQPINDACAHEKLIKVGKPTNLHLWWARRPLAAARAVIFAQLVDDPSSCPEEFPTEAAQETERQRLFRLIEELVQWENTTNERVLNQAREEIKRSWCRACADNADHPRAAELFDPDRVPGFHDPFAGGGAIPLEAQRLGLEAWASDLNPVAVLINNALIDLIPRFIDCPSINPKARTQKELINTGSHRTLEISDDLEYYGQLVVDAATERLSRLYPHVEVTPSSAINRQDLQPYVGDRLTPIAWIWARTVPSPDPAFSDAQVPLISNYILSDRKGKEVFLQPRVDGHQYEFSVMTGRPRDKSLTSRGTKSPGRQSGFTCLLSGAPITFDYVAQEARAGRMSQRLLAIVAEGRRSRVYLSANREAELIAVSSAPDWKPEVPFFENALGFRIGKYGMTTWADIFSDRQLCSLNVFSNLIREIRSKIIEDYLLSKKRDDESTRSEAEEYANLLSLLLSFCLSRVADWNNTLCRWESKAQVPQQLMARQIVSMTWDFCEANPLSSSTGSFIASLKNMRQSLSKFCLRGLTRGTVVQANAMTQVLSRKRIVSTDPPYYDNVGYADLSDFFYIWIRRTLRESFPNIFAALVTPKNDELVATPGRHGSSEEADAFFLNGMRRSFRQIVLEAHPNFPVTIYYAFKQSETKLGSGTVSTGWETFLAAVIDAGFTISATWPMRMENSGRLRSHGANALASTIVLACRRRNDDAPVTTVGAFLSALRAELPRALGYLQEGYVPPVDLAQAAIGPGMAIFSGYAQILEADDSQMGVRRALQLINQVVDEVFNEDEQELDSDTRFALTWYETYAFKEGPYGEAETLAKAKGVSVEGVAEAGILKSGGGKVRLLKRSELPDDWDPADDERLTVWEATQHLIKRLEAGGEEAAAGLLEKLGPVADKARALSYRLYTTCERKKWAEEARAYNALGSVWGDLEKLAGASTTEAPTETQAGLFEGE